MLKRLAIVFASLLALAIVPAAVWSQQVGDQPLSPPAKAICKFPDGKTITVDYSSPRMRGRKIYGDLVPYREVWRAGANEATTFVSNVDLVIGERTVAAGKYTLFAVPNPDRWLLVISKQTGEWGIPYPGASYDLLRALMKVSKLPAPVENFVIAFDQDAAACTMRLDGKPRALPSKYLRRNRPRRRYRPRTPCALPGRLAVCLADVFAGEPPKISVVVVRDHIPE